ncbi:3-oxoacyl-ACP reductase [Thiohalocapsa halophila]|uniref:3-oxoacyl-[acyl-carrier-protein] reductase n=1 Tax=Thiohalocapsa halophila TaxID=69359 RepID=A0ABS1CMH0_9GAMM|nr:3-oxoacyl-ACP reductase FabG [Thiohalocapsa halophila]MBK1633138.1 3-oxoacyl-ACP reductase [Thiohalocapsa halophila]
MLDGEVALVTGASRGIGRAIAEALLAQGAAVAGTATTEGGAVRIRDELAGDGRRVLGLRLDVTDPASVASVLAQVSDGLGAAPGILVNNAGITRDGLLMRMQDADWDAIIDTNLSSVYRITKACLRPMTKARKGRIINIASVVAASGNAGQTNYAAAKAGMIGFTKSLAREVGARGITANCVAPGFIDTDMTRGLGEQQREGLLASIPLGRLGAADEVAAAVAFLASPAAAYITGETLHVNGGMYMA